MLTEKTKKPIPAPRMKKRDFSKRPIPAPRNLLNIKNPEINVPVLKPEIVVVKEKQAPTVIKKTVETFSGWMNWLAESGKKIIKLVSATLKNLKEKINAIFQEKKFEVREGQSALKNFATEYIIDGKNGYDPPTFFETVKNLILDIFRENKNTKVKLTLNCKMQRTDFNTGKSLKLMQNFIQESKQMLKKQMKKNY